jgi:NAD-dependent SIR2 family protein deacetylase
LLLEANYVVGLTGAGISVESGIPPFRGPGGLWTKYGEPPMNGYERFLQEPRKAWEERCARSAYAASPAPYSHSWSRQCGLYSRHLPLFTRVFKGTCLQQGMVVSPALSALRLSS